MRKHQALCILSLLAVSLAGCVQKDENASNNPAPANATSTAASPAKTKGPNDRLKIAVVPKGTTHQFWQTIHAGADAAGKEMNADILWNGPKSEADKLDQVDILNNFGSQGVDGIAVAATDKNALVDVVNKLSGQGITIVTIDSGVASDVPKAAIATDNVAAARLAAKEMGRLLNGKGKIAILSFMKGSQTSDEREQGFTEGIKEFPAIQIVTTEYTDSGTDQARNKMETLLTANPDLVGVFASNEPNVVGAAGVVKDRKLTGKVKLIGFDASDPEIKYLQDDVVQAMVVQDPFKMGYEGVKAVAQIVRGQGTPPKHVDTGATLVTKDNLNDPKVHKLLYPLEK